MGEVARVCGRLGTNVSKLKIHFCLQQPTEKLDKHEDELNYHDKKGKGEIRTLTCPTGGTSPIPGTKYVGR